VEPREAYAAGVLPPHHRDPFDRLLVAQSLDRAVSVISHDEVFDRYGVSRVWP
jgi:PIN domain nuclease of toxin-antitoxin system